jgi:predicted HTH domain antitoxin
LATEFQVITIALAAELEQQLSREEAALHLAIGLFTGENVTLGQAAAIAGISQPAFLQELGKRQIPVHYEFITTRHVGR